MTRLVYTFVGVALLATPWSVQTATAQPAGEHPLKPVLALAEECLGRIDSQISGYTCTLVKRERVGDRLLDHEFAELKLRHRRLRPNGGVVPFAVYMRFLGPAELAGREVVLVEDRYRGKLIARRGGQRFAFMTMALDPMSEPAMRRNRYPVTHIGIRNLIRRLLEVGEEELRYSETEVTYFNDATVDDRRCTVLEVRHPVRRDHFRFHVARIYVDDELRLPIRFASYDWPEKEGGNPRLVEEYTYTDLKLNVVLSDRDFDYRNPAYGFSKDFRP